MSGGGVMGNVWTDIPPINSQAQERLGYPTQKPLALLERTIAASSNEGDVVLDPFRGCWTAVHAVQKLNRQWIGIDITYLAIGLIERRLIDAFPGFQFEVFGVPKDFNGAVDVAKRDKFQFQWWAVTLINAVPMAGKGRAPTAELTAITTASRTAKRPKLELYQSRAVRQSIATTLASYAGS